MSSNNNGGPSLLHKYIIKNDMDGLRELLQLKDTINLNVDILSMFIDNGFSGEGTPLHAAILRENYEAAQLLLECGADVNKQLRQITQSIDKIHNPLHLAIAKKDIKMVELLLEHGADVNFKNSSYNTPLCSAIMYGNRMDIVKLLLQRDDIDINLSNNHGATAFHYSFILRDPDLIRELLKDSNLNVNAKSIIGCTALHSIPTGSELEEEKNIDAILDIIESFSSRFEINVQDNTYGNTPLHLVAKDMPKELANHVIERLETIFSNSLNKNLKNKDGKTYADILALRI